MSRLTRKLIIMFVSIILIYAAVLFINFSTFTSDVLNSHHVEVIHRAAENIAETFQSFLPKTISSDNFISEIKDIENIEYILEVVKDVSYYNYYLCDQTGSCLFLNEEKLSETNELDLTQEAEEIRQKALKGITSSIEIPLSKSHIIVSASPIFSKQNETVGIILILHKAADSIETQQKINHFLLIITTIALMVVMILIMILSTSFTAPIRKITQIANELAHGNLDVKTNIHQKDEIGQLAISMDQLTVELKKSRELQENKLKIHDQFLADISHELKTPVTVMRGSLELLVDGIVQNPQDIAKYHQQMLAESKYLQKLIQDLLMISTLKNKEFTIQDETIDLSEVMSDTAMSARSLALAKNINFITCTPKYNFTIQGDYELIRKLLMLILDNAIKYTESGKNVYYMQDDDGNIIIKDEGQGISEESLPHIFERFYRQKKGIESGSSGMGLAIAKEIANRHHIEIQVNSVVNEGTTFKLLTNAKK